MKDDFRVYVLVRTDMASMTTGRIAAQCHHASDALRYQILTKKCYTSGKYEAWASSTEQGFGTVIILKCDEQQMYDQYNLLACRLPSVVVHDPEYLIKDGDYVHKIPVDTCAAFLVSMNGQEQYFSHFELL